MMKKIVLDIQSNIHAHTMERMLMQEPDIEPGEPEDPTDAEFSPDSAAEDIGKMAEEIGEAAEEGEAIIAALL